jgi:hypothetical protein
MQRRRTLVEGDYELCQEPLVDVSCNPDPNECCEYTQYSMCDCQTEKQRRTIKKGNSSYCTDPLEKYCDERDLTNQCCNRRGVYFTDSSGNRRCDCTGSGYKGPKCEFNNEKCNNNGILKDDLTCDCSTNFDQNFINQDGKMCTKCIDGFYGPDCKKTRTNWCNDRGTPTLDGNKCVCDRDNSGNFISAGTNCEYTSANKCNGRGTPMDNGKCRNCSRSYYGDYCEENKCNSRGTVEVDNSGNFLIVIQAILELYVIM